MAWFSGKQERRKTYPKLTTAVGVAEGLAATSDKVPFLFTQEAMSLKSNKFPKHSHTLPSLSPTALNDAQNTVEQNSHVGDREEYVPTDKENLPKPHNPTNTTPVHRSSTRKSSGLYKTVITKIEARKLRSNLKSRRDSAVSTDKPPTDNQTSTTPASNQRLASRMPTLPPTPPLSDGGRSSIDTQNGGRHYPDISDEEIRIASSNEDFEVQSNYKRPLAYQASATPPLVIDQASSPPPRRPPSITSMVYTGSNDSFRKDSLENFDWNQDRTVETGSGSHEGSFQTSMFDDTDTIYLQNKTLGETNDISLQLSSLTLKEEPLPEHLDLQDQPSSLEVLMAQHGPADLTGSLALNPGPPVASGGVASVHFGDWDGKLVAVKVLMARKNPKNPAEWETSMERRLRREISVWAALSHPNIVEFYGYATGLSDFPVMVSEWCRNGNASQYLERNPSLTHQDRFSLAQDVARGLEYLHSLKVIHGDLKPQNVLITDERKGQLCDFGLVSLAEWHGPAGMTTTSPHGGTVRYKAPDLFPSKTNRNPKPSFYSDVYALGCVTYEFIDLKQPFHGSQTIYDILDSIRDGEPPALRPDNLQMPAAVHLWDLLEACWRLTPLERPSANDVVLGLQSIHDIRYG